ncbi:MAG: hypothetical protein ACP5KW_11270, partial [Thermoproteota archaeon]
MRFIHQVEEVKKRLLSEELSKEAKVRLRWFIEDVSDLVYNTAILCNTLENINSLELFRNPRSLVYKKAEKDVDSSITALDLRMFGISQQLFKAKPPPLLEEARAFLSKIKEAKKDKRYSEALLACWDMQRAIYEFSTTDFNTIE